ncbi:hypothetical protein HTZ84_09495 [Haloterrigena sp. SYSU A558-1]|uniref:Uncharacterized protein n=1 Tax=Haloterrigena gelatinilytica TaxID=2741724 RepID=A0ABX2LHE6_9EURY|nr:hypothetical protein [Haloterrigena gelatinilytica]NUC72539.1 hypothetical protein [Haloterrigena gelatinilytica]
MSALDKEDFYITSSGLTFAPTYVPTRISISKSRNLNREDNFCGTEDVSDLGSKNREVHVSGVLRESEIPSFGNLLNANYPLTIISPGWSGEIRVMDGECEGPRAFDPRNREPLYKYSLNVLSTGKNEGDGHGEDDHDDHEH